MMRPSFRRYALFTTALTGLLMALGVYTAATGSGLACAQQWPLCDGGLFPETLPSFIEWFHRLVAMVTGFVIMGLVGWAWRTDRDRRTRLAATAALVLLPLQVSIGAITVTLNGAIPAGYSVPTHAAHLLAALSIFTALLFATVFAYEGHHRRGAVQRSQLLLGLALVALPVNAAFGRVTFLLDYEPGAQALFVVTGLFALATLLVAGRWLADADRRRARLATLAAAGTVLVVLLLGRDLVAYTDAVHLVNLACYVVAGGLTVVAASAIRGVAGSDDPAYSLTD